MHTATKVMLILGGIFAIIGVIMWVMGAAALEYDPIGDAEWSGKDGNFNGESDAWYNGYAEVDSCDDITYTVTDADGGTVMSSDGMWSSCNDDTASADGYVSLGMGFSDSEPMPWSVDSSHTIYFSDTGEEAGEAAGGIMSILGSWGMLCCGGFFLLLGGIFALTLKEGGDTVVVVQGGAQQPMMAATGMAAPQYEQPVQYQQPPQGGM
jgi:hypothetical protein